VRPAPAPAPDEGGAVWGSTDEEGSDDDGDVWGSIE
jgi:hypothetical protein